MQLLTAANGATLPELMQAVEWQAHSVRGYISGTLKKKLGLVITSQADAQGDRRYKLEA